MEFQFGPKSTVHIRLQTISQRTGKIVQGTNLLHFPIEKTDEAYKIIQEVIKKLKSLQDEEV